MLFERVIGNRKNLSAVVLWVLLSLNLLSPSSRFCADDCHSKEKGQANSHACCASQATVKSKIKAKADCECSLHAHQVDAREPNWGLNLFGNETWKALAADLNSSAAILPNFLETALRVLHRFNGSGQGTFLLSSNLRI